MKKILFAILALSAAAFAQIPYAFMPPPQSCFADSNGVPLAGGFLYSYAAGTSTPLATYHLDTLGNITANQNPIILSSIGCAEVRLVPQAYKFVLQNSASVQIWAVDQVQDIGQSLYSQSVLLNPVGLALQTINGPLDIIGSLIVSGPVTATNFPSPIITSPTITSPIINGTTMTGAPGTYYFASNGTAVINSLVSLLPGSFGTAEITPAGATGQIVGIMTGTQDIHIIIQTTGLSTCLFDGPAQAPNYIQASPTVPGSCHDAGPNYPAGGQVLGRVLVNISSATTAFVLLQSEVRAGGGGAVCANRNSVTVNSATTSDQIMKFCQIPGIGSLNVVNKTIRVSGWVHIGPNSSTVETLNVSFGVTSSLGSNQAVLNPAVTTASPFTVFFNSICTVTATGSPGALSCSGMANADNAGVVAFFPPSGFSSSANIDLTGPVFVGVSCAFAAPSTSNTCTQNTFLVEVLN